jgi:hypothetical protein
MKTLLLMLFVTIASAQIEISIHQDIKLATLGDNHGNNAFTSDVKISLSMHGKQFKYYYFEVRPEFEYAELSGGKYVSWLVNAGWTYNKLVIDNLNIGGYFTTGIIHRWDVGYFTYGITGDLSYGKTIKVSLLGQLIKRPDLKDKWGTTGLKPSLYLGIKYLIK